MQPKIGTYEFEENKSIRYSVWIEKLESGIKAECSCPEYQYHGKWCNHIDKAITCFELGF